MSTITYHRLTPHARATIRSYYGVSIADYVRWSFPDGQWRGDACGCNDDRCIGHHHADDEECGCLRAILEEQYPMPW